MAGDSPLPFWRQELTPARLSGIGAVWIFDGRLGVHPALMPLPALLKARDQIRAGVLAPPVSYQHHNQHRGGGAAVAGPHEVYALAEEAFASSRPGCSATTVGGLPSLDCAIFSGSAWALFHREFLARWGDGAQRRSSRWAAWGIEAKPGAQHQAEPSLLLLARVACAIVHAKYEVDPACVMLRSPQASLPPAPAAARPRATTHTLLPPRPSSPSMDPSFRPVWGCVTSFLRRRDVAGALLPPDGPQGPREPRQSHEEEQGEGRQRRHREPVLRAQRQRRPARRRPVLGADAGGVEGARLPHGVTGGASAHGAAQGAWPPHLAETLRVVHWSPVVLSLSLLRQTLPH